MVLNEPTLAHKPPSRATFCDQIATTFRVVATASVKTKAARSWKRRKRTCLNTAPTAPMRLIRCISEQRNSHIRKFILFLQVGCYKEKEGVSQRVISLYNSLHSTSVTDGATLYENVRNLATLLFIPFSTNFIAISLSVFFLCLFKVLRI